MRARFILLLCLCTLFLATAAAKEWVISATAPGSVFIENHAPTFTIQPPHGDSSDLRYCLTDWRGRHLKDGKWPGKTLTLPPLQPGYYFLQASRPDHTPLGQPRSFAVVVAPASRTPNPESFFAVDTAQSWLAIPGKIQTPDGYRLVSDLVRLAGITHVRDRLAWNDINPKPGEYQWGRYMENAQLLQERGIQISSVYARCPAYTQQASPRLPDDLLATWTFARDAALAFKDKVTTWEVWNEPDIHYAPEPVWEFAATVKAAYLGHKAGAPAVPVLHGALCSMVRTSYDYGLYANDLWRYSDGVNFHTYAAPIRLPKIFGEFREFMKKCGIENRALWVTENGTNLEGIAKNATHTPQQELLVAEYLPKAQILLMMEGVARSYFFVFPPCNERNGRKDWGILRRDGTVKPAYTVFSTLTHQLSHGKLLGEVKISPKVRAFLFQMPDQSQTLVFWSPSGIDSATNAIQWDDNWYQESFSIALKPGKYHCTDAMGGNELLQTDTQGTLRLNACRFPAYLSGISGLKAHIPPHPAGKIQAGVFQDDEDPTVIIKPYLDKKDFKITNQKSLANLNQESGRMRLEIWNLSPTAKSGYLQIDGALVQGMDDPITLPAYGKAVQNVIITPHLPGPDGVRTITITGFFQDKKTSHAQIPIYMQQVALGQLHPLPLEWENPQRWRKNDSAITSSITYDPTEKALKIQADFGGKYAWIYPEYTLELPKESLKNAAMLSFEIKSVQDKVENDFNYTYVMLVNKDVNQHGKAEYIDYPRPMTHWETRVVPLHSVKMHLDSVRMLRIGMNPKGSKLTYWLRNVKLYLKTPPEK